MPDQSDVETALAAVAVAALYPEGVSGVPVVGVLCRVFRGMPEAAGLNADLLAGRVNVSVVPVEGSYRATTRFLSEVAKVATVPTLQVTVSGDSVSFTGAADAGQLAGVLVDGSTHVYRTADGDTPALVAAALAALVRAERPAVLSGAGIAFPGAVRVVARTAADTAEVTEQRRQTQEFRVTVWAPSVALRDAVCGVLDGAFAVVPFLDVEGVGCRAVMSGSSTADPVPAAKLYRRDLLLAVEYPTTVTVRRPAMLFGDSVVNGQVAFS